jgi:RNA polymerase sigma-70 factor (TIGR02960 family)
MTTALRPPAPAGIGETDPVGILETDPVVDAAVAGDEVAFAVLVERHRRELHGYCVRMLGSREPAEDAVQEALLRAWRSRSHFAGRASFRTWLYRIATNACLDEMRRDRSRPRSAAAGRSVTVDDGSQLPTDVAASTDPQPDAVVEAREVLEQAFRAVIELLPARQRAVLVLCDVLRCPATETAALLDTTAGAVTSALQRARARLSAQRPSLAPDPLRMVRLGPGGQDLLDRYVDAVRRHDVAAVIALARADDAAGSTGSPARPVRIVISKARDQEGSRSGRQGKPHLVGVAVGAQPPPGRVPEVAVLGERAVLDLPDQPGLDPAHRPAARRAARPGPARRDDLAVER